MPRSCLFYRSVARKIDWIAWCAGLGVNVVPVTCRDSGFPKNNQPGAVREAPACCNEALQVEWPENSAAELGDLFSAPFSSLSMSLVSVALPREVPRAGDALRGGLGAVLPPSAPLPEPSVLPGICFGNCKTHRLLFFLPRFTFTCFCPRAEQLQPPRDRTSMVSWWQPPPAASAPWGAQFQLQLLREPLPCL